MIKFDKPLFITGTDTGIGKTVLSLRLMQHLFANGYAPFYLKPAQTGCADPYDTDSDAKFIYRNVAALSSADPAASVVYCFRNPKAPLFAARDDGREIDPEVIKKAVNKKMAAVNPLIIEGAGGALVPVTEGLMMADLALMLGAVPIVAARAGLGTINHTLLTIEALERRGLEAAAIVFLDGGEEPTSPGMVEENIEAIESSCGIKVAGTIGRIKDFANPMEQACPAIANLMGLLAGYFGRQETAPWIE